MDCGEVDGVQPDRSVSLFVLNGPPSSPQTHTLLGLCGESEGEEPVLMERQRRQEKPPHCRSRSGQSSTCWQTSNPERTVFTALLPTLNAG